MSKRNRSFENSGNKKHKLDEDIDALWGDDLDETALDVCIKLATQAFEEDKVCTQNNTTLPSYSFFKKPDAIFASTQLNSKPSTSKAFSTYNYANPEDTTILRQKYEEKEGEVAVLRSQIKEIKVNHNIEQQRIQSEWKHKLISTEKEVHSIRSELEFKNLEIANLKQQLSVIARRTISASPSTSGKNTTTLIRHNSNKETKETPILNAICPLYGSPLAAFPLKDALCEQFLNTPKIEKHTIKTKVINPCRNAIPYLQNRAISSRTIVEDTNLGICHIMSSVYGLVNSSESDLDSDECIRHIDKIIWATYELLNSFNGLLNAIKLNLRTEDLLGSDSNYLNNHGSMFNHSTDSNHEIGKKVSVMIQFLSILIGHSCYMKKYFHQDNTVKCPNSLIGLIRIQGSNITGTNMLDKILSTVKLIGEIRISDITTTFLSSSINFFVSLCKIECYDIVKDVFCEFTKETIFLRPSHDIVFQLTYLFKEASQIPSFLEYLFNKSKANSTNTKGVIYFSNDACRFYIYAMQFENASNQVQFVPLSITMNMLSFIYNTYKSAYWIHHIDIKGCDCLAQLYKLVMDILFKASENYKKDRKKSKKQKSEWVDFFKNKITKNVINLMTFHSYELTEKYITVLAEYKEIEKLLEDEGLSDVENGGINEDLPDIDSALFVDW